MSTISFDCVDEHNYLRQFVERILPNDCICVSLMLDRDTDHVYLIRLERGLEPMLIKLNYERRYNEEFRQIMSENDASMKCTDRRKFWNVRNGLNRTLKSFLGELEANVFGRHRVLLLGSFGVDERLEQSVLDEFKRRFFTVTLTKDRLLCLKLILLGLDRTTTSEQICTELRFNFETSHISEIERWISESVKPRVIGLSRKHVCLIVDRVINLTILLLT